MQLYPSSPLKETKFQNLEKKNTFYLKPVNIDERNRRKECIPEIPDELKTKLRQLSKNMLERRSSSGALQIKRSKHAPLEPQLKELDRLYTEIIVSFQKKPNSFEQIKEQFKDVLVKIADDIKEEVK